MKRFLCGLGVFSVLGLMAAGCTAGDPSDGDEDEVTNEAAADDLAPTGKGLRILGDDDAPLGQSKAGGPADVVQYGINYHNGPVMKDPIKLYFIWYGNWSDATAKAILTDWASNVNNTPWWNISTTYANGSNQPTSNSVTLGGQTTNNYSNGKSLSDNAIKSIVTNAINGGQLPKDGNGIYFVLTASDVTATSGFCSQYCGWHTAASIGGTQIKYSFVGNPQTKCLSSCAAQTNTSPNSTSGNNYAGIDAMASILAHEATEAATDPQLNAWYDAQGYENADKCAWTFGTTSAVGNGSQFNVTVGPRKYLIQQNWSNVSPSGKCTMSYP